jgi:hypothetical protein
VSNEAIEKAILVLAIDKPAFGQVCVSNELRKQGLFVSPRRRAQRMAA